MTSIPVRLVRDGSQASETDAGVVVSDDNVLTPPACRVLR